MVQVSVSSPGATLNADGSITLLFTPETWNQARIVTVTAIDDAVVDGNDLQAFADLAQRTHLIQGPLYVFGGSDPDPAADRSIPPAIMLPGETPGTPVTPQSQSLNVVEANQVDTLNVFNNDSVSDDIGNLTSTRLTGLGMGLNQFVSGRSLQGGITYDGLEALNIHLGHGVDRFTIETTHFGTTRV